MTNFVIQERALAHDIWFEPETGLYRHSVPITRADTISELVAALETYADKTMYDWRQHFRIITSTGKPVARFVIRPGQMRQTRGEVLMFLGSKPAPPTSVSRHRACSRCGLIRESRSSTVLCRDCRGSMTRAEIQRWVA